jgi:hypothetical protein
VTVEVRQMCGTTGHDFARALATKDRVRLHGMLADPLDFQALTPDRVWEAGTPRRVVDEVILGLWFEAGDDIQKLRSVVTGRVADREHIADWFRIRNGEENFLVEQQAYYTVKDGKIDWMRILCSGYRPAEVVD